MPWTIGRTPDVYRLPTLRLEVTDAPGLANAAVASASIERELVSSVIPGNIRSDNGLSVGAGDVTLVYPNTPGTPWSASTTTRVTTGKAARLYARDADGNEKSLGAWVTDGASGSLSSREVPVELIEAQGLSKEMRQALPAYQLQPFTPGAQLDPIWTVSRLAEQAGFYSIPPYNPEDGAFIGALAMDGGIHLQQPLGQNITTDGQVTGWTHVNGTIFPTTGSFARLLSTDSGGGRPISAVLAKGGAVYFTLCIYGDVYIVDASQGWGLKIKAGAQTLETSNSPGSPFGNPKETIPDYTANRPWTNRVQVELRRPSTRLSDGRIQWQAVRARIREISPDGFPDSGWSAVSEAGGSFTPTTQGIDLVCLAGGISIPGTQIPASPYLGGFAGVQITQSITVGHFRRKTAFLKPLGGDAGLPWVEPKADVWSSMRDALSARSAAAILETEPVQGGALLRVLNRDDLAGVGIAGVDTDIGAEWADLPWELDPEDTVDRVEVTFAAPQITTRTLGSSDFAPAAWEASEVVKIPAGEKVVITAEFENKAAIGLFGSFNIPTTPNALWSQTSSVIAFNSPDGTGTPIALTDFAISARQTSATTAEITIFNPKPFPIYLVDGNGDPHLVLRAASVATFETTQIIERGAKADVAQRPLEVNLTPWVQSKADAENIADYLYARLAYDGLWKAESVECRLDWDHNLGRILRARHPRTGLLQKVLTTKVDLDFDGDSITQNLGIVVLPWTWADLDTSWSAKTWTDFDTAWSSLTWTDFDINPLRGA